MEERCKSCGIPLPSKIHKFGMPYVHEELCQRCRNSWSSGPFREDRKGWDIHRKRVARERERLPRIRRRDKIVPPFFSGARERTRTSTPCGTRTSSVPGYQLQHPGVYRVIFAVVSALITLTFLRESEMTPSL